VLALLRPRELLHVRVTQTSRLSARMQVHTYRIQVYFHLGLMQCEVMQCEVVQCEVMQCEVVQCEGAVD